MMDDLLRERRPLIGSISKLKESIELKIEYLQESIDSVEAKPFELDKDSQEYVSETSHMITYLQNVLDKIEEYSEDPIDLSTSLEDFDF